MRKFSDLPLEARQVIIYVKSHKWFCQNNKCKRRVFTERLPWIAPHRRRVQRMEDALRAVVFSTNAVQAEKVCHLFQRRRVPFVGIDDFSFKKRQRYGVIICDALTSEPIDLLPDRTVETLKSWLRNYPPIQRISRDRFARFREEIVQVFPRAIQIHDRSSHPKSMDIA